MVVSMVSSRAVVSCNVYVSAGRPHHANLLLSILSQAQEQCRILRQQSKQILPPTRNPKQLSEVAIIHAFTDGPYDRSSFHVAGYADSVAHVASFLATTAMRTIYQHNQQQQNNNNNNDHDNTLHPYVGIVDHVSVMPLLHPPYHLSHLFESSSASTPLEEQTQTQHFIPSTAHGQAAYAIGQAMSNEPLPFHNNNTSTTPTPTPNVQVFYYGGADPDNTPLAHVRKHKTSFFRSGGLQQQDKDKDKGKDKDTTQTQTFEYGIATVGAAPQLVENFNVRLTSHASRSKAIQLARLLRACDGPDGKDSHTGLPGVEALTLPYSDHRYEVACNLLQPKNERGNANAILKVVQDWEHSMMEEMRSGEDNIKPMKFVDCAYRVGTTEELCWNLLQCSQDGHPNNNNGGDEEDEDFKSNLGEDADEVFMKKHDAVVAQRLKSFILG